MPPALRLIAASAALSLVVTACVTTASGGREEASSTPTPSPTQAQPTSTATVLIRATSTPPRPTPTLDPTRTAIAAATEAAYLCSPELGERILTGLIEAFNAGDWRSVESFMPEESMPYLSSTVVLGEDLDQFRGSYMRGSYTEQVIFKTAEDLYEWLVKRRTFNEYWFLQDVVIGDIYRNPQARSPELADFAIQFVRQADDLRTSTFLARGYVNCVHETLIMFWGFFHEPGVSEVSAFIGHRPVPTDIPER